MSDLDFLNFQRENLNYNDVWSLVNTGDWWMEEKLDGIRAGITKRQNGVTIYTKNQVNITSKFPHIVEMVEQQFAGYPWAFDGEIISNYGHNDVQAVLAQSHPRLPADPTIIKFVPFDLLMWPNCQEAFKQPLRTRRVELEQFCRKTNFMPVPQRTIPEEMMKWYDILGARKAEGVVLKRWDDKYNRHVKWYRSKFTDTISVVPMDIDDDTLMVRCAMLNPDNPDDFRHVCDVQVTDMEDMMMILNHMNAFAAIQPILEVAVHGIDNKGNLRHATYKGLRFDAGFVNCYTDQLDKLRKF